MPENGIWIAGREQIKLSVQGPKVYYYYAKTGFT